MSLPARLLMVLILALPARGLAQAAPSRGVVLADLTWVEASTPPKPSWSLARCQAKSAAPPPLGDFAGGTIAGAGVPTSSSPRRSPTTSIRLPRIPGSTHLKLETARNVVVDIVGLANYGAPRYVLNTGFPIRPRAAASPPARVVLHYPCWKSPDAEAGPSAGARDPPTSRNLDDVIAPTGGHDKAVKDDRPASRALKGVRMAGCIRSGVWGVTTWRPGKGRVVVEATIRHPRELGLETGAPSRVASPHPFSRAFHAPNCPLLMWLAVACAQPAAPPAGYDVVISGGKIVDGTGNAFYYGDVGIRGDRIVAVTRAGALDSVAAATRLDARGRVVAPGFIDIHTHSWNPLLVADGRVLSKVTQGVTSEILGEATTPAPSNPSVDSLFDEHDPEGAAMRAEMGKFRGTWDSGLARRWRPTATRERRQLPRHHRPGL
jgi:hypothetical protein